jgi:hypothetical protein
MIIKSQQIFHQLYQIDRDPAALFMNPHDYENSRHIDMKYRVSLQLALLLGGFYAIYT